MKFDDERGFLISVKEESRVRGGEVGVPYFDAVGRYELKGSGCKPEPAELTVRQLK